MATLTALAKQPSEVSFLHVRGAAPLGGRMFQNGDIMSVQLIFVVFVNARVSSHQNHLSLKLSLGRQKAECEE